MDDGQGKKPKDAREERLKQALRENLKRRKAQARRRKDDECAARPRLRIFMKRD